MTTTATIKWVETYKGTARVFIVARVPRPHQRGFDADPTTGEYRQHEHVDVEHEQRCHVWRNTIKGALIASICERAMEFHLPLRIEYDDTAFGWRLTGAEVVERETAP